MLVFIIVLKAVVLVLSGVYLFQSLVHSHAINKTKNTTGVFICLGTILLFSNDINNHFSSYEISKAEQMLWQSVEEYPSADTYQVYLTKYPDGHFTDIARIQLARLPPLPLIPTKMGWQTIEHYQINGGLVIDTKTNLMWMRCSIGLNWDGNSCQGEEATYATWDQAIRISKQFEYANYDDWHLPSHEELRSLVHCSHGITEKDRCGIGICRDNSSKPTIKQEIFPNTPASVFWSSSSADFSSELAWRVNFNIGSDELGYLNERLPFRLVRNAK